MDPNELTPQQLRENTPIGWQPIVESILHLIETWQKCRAIADDQPYFPTGFRRSGDVSAGRMTTCWLDFDRPIYRDAGLLSEGHRDTWDCDMHQRICALTQLMSWACENCGSTEGIKEADERGGGGWLVLCPMCRKHLAGVSPKDLLGRIGEPRPHVFGDGGLYRQDRMDRAWHPLKDHEDDVIDGIGPDGEDGIDDPPF